MGAKLEQHEWIQKLQEMAIALGRTPFREEFTKEHRHGWSVMFGGWAAFVQAAGLEKEASRPRKIDNTIFNKDIEVHMADYEPIATKEVGPYPKIISWSDLHRPFINKRVEERVLECLGDEKPEFFVENGDGDDQFSHSKFAKSLNVFSPREERALSRKQHEDFWKEAISRSPKTKFIKMLGNHCIRPMKRILDAYPAAEDWITEALKKDFSFDGVETIFDHREEYIIGDIAVFHGYKSQLGAHRDYTLMNTINGHTHRGGVVFKRIRGQTLWELNSGLSGDPEGKGLTYTAQRMTDWTPGFGMVDKRGPRFIPV